MKPFFLVLFIASILSSCKNTEQPEVEDETAFSFAFFTDIHLNMGNNGCFDGFGKAITDARSKNVDFIMTGGDNVDIDVLKGDGETAHKLFQRFDSTISVSNVEFYTAIGNHDRFWGVENSDPLYNHGLFEKYLGKTYYSFSHKGWQFIVLNTSNYEVDEDQKTWLGNELKNIDISTPIVMIAHVPFLSVYYPVLEGRYTSTDTFSNFKEIWDMFAGKNLKLVLQGHMHLYEEIKVKDIIFISAGAVSASWWGGPYHGTEEGYLLVNVKGDQFDWEYVNYGWEAKK
jgi:predicted phosphodiesterase